jgi:exodeoxyribonuclease V alpha subunit
MNGETGIVTQLDFDTGSVTIDFGDREVTIPPLIISVTNDGRVFETDPRTMIDLAYVLTTHKAQGSEYQHVCYVMNRATSFAQSRRNFYTGITRARKHCTLFTDQHSLVKSTRYAG